MSIEADLERLGYTMKWIDSGILTPEVLSEQVNSASENTDSKFEHERLGVLRKWISERIERSDIQIEAFIEIAQSDPDKNMSGSALMEMLDNGNLTSLQFERIASILPQFGGWTTKRIDRAKIKRENSTIEIEDRIFEKCLSMKDASVYRWLIEHPKITHGQLKKLSELADSKAIRNRAKDSLKSRRWKA